MFILIFVCLLLEPQGHECDPLRRQRLARDKACHLPLVADHEQVAHTQCAKQHVGLPQGRNGRNSYGGREEIRSELDDAMHICGRQRRQAAAIQ